jgi:glyoxylase-like metal-dependent hydrolase (beta-lactamase superfamily II)
MTLAKPTFSALETSSGYKINRIPLEAFPNFWAFAYLVQIGEWNVLIDTGSGSEMSNTSLEQGIASTGMRLSDLTHILLTHGHIDHYGGLSYLRERTQARIGVHELDLSTVTTHEARLAMIENKLNIFLAKSDVPTEMRIELLTMYKFTKKIYRSVAVDFTYEALGMKVGPLELIHVPGHCAGHVALKLDDVIFCGDLILDRVIPHQSPEEILPFLGIHHFLISIIAFERWAAGTKLILNGHDEPIHDLARGIEKMRNRLFQRINQTLAALGKPRTIVETTEQVYRDTNGYNALLVIEKVGAYIEYLHQRGLVEISNSEEIEDNPQAAIKYHRIERNNVVW